MAQDKNRAARQDKGPVTTVKIADEVVASIAAYAALDVDGVSSLGGGLGMDDIARVSAKKLSKTLRVEVGKEGVKVDIALIVKYGCSIPQISTKVQDRIVKSVENMTGLSVPAVNVRVVGMEMNE